MSASGIVPVTCPKCGRESSFKRWSSLNVTLDPAEKARLQSGELLRFTCPHCRETAEVVTSLLYHDMERRAMIWLLPSDPNGAAAEAPEELGASLGLGKSMNDYTFRRVPTRNALIEKIAIVDAGLSDVVIEVAKLLVHRQATPGEQARLREIRFDGIVPGERGEQIAFVMLLNDGNVKRVSADRSLYEIVDRDTSPEMKRPAGPWPRVDETTIADIRFGGAKPPAKPGFFGRLFGRG